MPYDEEAMAMSDDDRCVCGHPREAHRHFRPGSDCGICGPATCPEFRRERRGRRARR